MKGWRELFPLRQARARPLAAFAAAALTGAILAWAMKLPAAACLTACAAAGFAACICAAIRRGLLAAALLLGLCLGMARMSTAIAAFPAVETRYSVEMVGDVISEPWLKPETGRLIFKFRLISANGAPEDMALRLYLRGDDVRSAGIEYGQRLAVTGHIWASDPVTNPYEFDFGEWLHRNDMAAIATAKIGQVEVLSARRDAMSVVIAARHAIGARIDALFPRSAGLVRALALGDRSMLSDELRACLNATGIAHLISISGLHVTVLAMAVSLLLGLFMSRRWAGLITLCPLLLYGALIGFTAPYTRALVMFGLFTIAQAAGLPSDAITRLSAALLLWLAIHPLSLLDGGFVLTFSASAGIILLTPPLLSLFHLDDVVDSRVEWHSWRRVLRQIAVYFAALLVASLAAQLATLPAVVACFGVQSVVSLPFNLICVPLCVTGYVLSMACLAASAVALPMARMMAPAADAILSLVPAIARISRMLPLTSIHIGRYPWPLALLHAGVILAASNLCRWPMKARRLLPLGLSAVAGLSALLAFIGAWPFSVTVLDADQANCAVVTTMGRTYVFDAGDTYTPVTDYLSATCLHLDGVFLSHPHDDHAGGLSDLLTAFRPDMVYVPAGWFDCEGVAQSVQDGIEQARALNIPIVEISAGDALPLSDRVAVTVYSPAGDGVPEDLNDLSLVLHVSDGAQSVLFTGDLTMDGEPEALPDCDVLHVPHHGADNATSYAMLLDTTPDYAVISVGENNYGHPGDYALERIAASGAEVLRTDRLGAIRLTVADGEWHVKTFLEAPDAVE